MTSRSPPDCLLLDPGGAHSVGVYLYVGGAEAVHALVLNESSGRLPDEVAAHAGAAAGASAGASAGAAAGATADGTSSPAAHALDAATLVAVGPRFHLRADRPLEDLRGEARMSSEDGALLHLPGLRRSPRARLAGARQLGDVEWDFERSRYGFHNELRLPPGFDYDDDDDDDGHEEGGDAEGGGAAEARFESAQAAYAAAQREALDWAPWGGDHDRADCRFWCRPGVHCVLQLWIAGEPTSTEQRKLDDLSSNRTGTLRDECRSCPECLQLESRPSPGRAARVFSPSTSPSELRQRLAGYAAMGAEPSRASAQRLEPCVLALGGYYYLLVQWYAPHATSRVMYGRSRSPLGPFVDRLGHRMDRTRTERLGASTYTTEAGVRHSGDDLNVSDWRPAGGEAYTHVSQSVRCGPTERLGHTTYTAGALAEAAVRAEGERFETPLVGEPWCETRHAGMLTTSLHALRFVNTASECLRYCAATAECQFFSFVGREAARQPWRDLANSCTLMAARHANTSSAASDGDDGDASGGASEHDEAFVWGAKPEAIVAEVPGGSLLLDGPAISLRGEARGPASVGGLAYLLPARRAGGPTVPLRLLLSFSFQATPRCAAYYERLARDEVSDGFEEGACETNHSTANATAASAIPRLGIRELVLTEGGWLQLSARGVAANASFEPNPEAQRQRMRQSRRPPIGNTASFGRAPHSLDVLGQTGCSYPLPLAFRHSPACARAYVAAPVEWDPAAAFHEPVDPIYAAQDARRTSTAVARSVAEAMWPLHLAPLPPACVDDPLLGAAARASQLGVEPPPTSCEAAAAAGLCADTGMRIVCPLSCEACPAALADLGCGFEPSLGPSNASSAAIESARHLLSPLVGCDAPIVMHVSRLDPMATPLAGGAPITVHGSGFTSPAACRFGEQSRTVRAFRVTPHKLVCHAPSLAAMRVANATVRASLMRVLSVRVASADDFEARWPASWSATGTAATLLAFNVTRLLSVGSLQPLGGPAAGGTMLTVHAPFDVLRPPDHASRAHLRCTFAADIEQLGVEGGGRRSYSNFSTATATVVSGRSARCRTPAAAGTADVRVGLEYAHTPNDAATAIFRYFEAAVVSTYPHGGPASGGTVVTVHGTGLEDMGGHDARGVRVHGLYCHFEPPLGPTRSAAAALSELASLAEAEAAVEALKAESFDSVGALASQLDPLPPAGVLARAEALETALLPRAEARASRAHAALEASALFGVLASTGRPRVATWLVPAHPLLVANGSTRRDR